MLGSGGLGKWWPLESGEDADAGVTPGPGFLAYAPDAVALGSDGGLMAASRIAQSGGFTWFGLKGSGRLQVVDASSGSVNPEFQNHRHPLTALAISPDGRLIASGSSFGFRFLHDLRTGRRLWRKPGSFNWIKIVVSAKPTRATTAVAFSPDSRRIAVGVQDGSIEIWDVNGDLVSFKTAAHSGPILGLAFNSRGTELATAGRDRTAKVWPLPLSEPRSIVHGHTDAVLTVRFSPDDALLVTGGQDGIARIWHPNEMKPDVPLLVELPRTNGYVSAVAFDSSGSRLAVGASSGTVSVWNLRRLQAVQEILAALAAPAHPEPIDPVLTRVMELITPEMTARCDLKIQRAAQ